jgi:hypothetical protein
MWQCCCTGCSCCCCDTCSSRGGRAHAGGCSCSCCSCCSCSCSCCSCCCCDSCSSRARGGRDSGGCSSCCCYHSSSSSGNAPSCCCCYCSTQCDASSHGQPQLGSRAAGQCKLAVLAACGAALVGGAAATTPSHAPRARAGVLRGGHVVWPGCGRCCGWGLCALQLGRAGCHSQLDVLLRWGTRALVVVGVGLLAIV